ncbi:NKG2-A/NKG2-B type II integral membrane protein-like [Acomys russatus]|uniref:NKG2-A/NKG2-B type II integral membrane protein-like n=1 Tax=Acomys russatus TaxID=60746 RepID=UPI0021E2A1B9|nr:NKG2-A/NKG2-B type II integral membrane protein-like [Acomys russatus]
MINEGVTYAELNVAKKSRDQQRKPRGTHSSISVVEQEITYAEFNFQKASPEHPAICRDCCCKGFPCPPEKLIAGTLGIIGFALMVAVVVVSTVTTPYTEAKVQINTSLTTTHRAHPCGCCPKESISYSHNCYYTGVEKKSWNDSLVSCASKNCNLLYIDSEEEQIFQLDKRLQFSGPLLFDCMSMCSFLSRLAIAQLTSRIAEQHRSDITGLQTPDMDRLFGTERASERREVAKKTQSQIRFSKGAEEGLLEPRLQSASQKHPKTHRRCYCKNFSSPPEKLISGILGIIWFALLVALVIVTRVVSSYTEPKEQIHSLLIKTQKGTHHNISSAHPCSHCPKEWISYSHNCFHIGVEKKTWSDSVVSCASKNCNLLYIDSEEEQDFLQSLSLVSWVGVSRKSRGQPWVWKNDSNFKPKISEVPYDEINCAMLSTSGLTADNCTALHTYLCECKLTN